MRNLVLRADRHHEFSLFDDYEGERVARSELPQVLLGQLDEWNARYGAALAANTHNRGMDLLDAEGKRLALRLQASRPDANVRYYSEANGELSYLGRPLRS